MFFCLLIKHCINRKLFIINKLIYFQGTKYGNLVLRMFVAWLARNYRFSTKLKMTDLKFRMDITLKLLNGHMIQIHKRQAYSL